MIHTETKFAYRHKPTGKWVFISSYFDDELWENDKYPYVHEMKLTYNLSDATLHEDSHILKTELKMSKLDGEKYAAQNFLEFELVEIEIEYRVKPSSDNEKYRKMGWGRAS